MRSGTRAPRGYLGILVLICAKAEIGRALAANPAMKLRREEMAEHLGISLSLKIDNVTFYALSPNPMITSRTKPQVRIEITSLLCPRSSYDRGDVLVLFGSELISVTATLSELVFEKME